MGAQGRQFEMYLRKVGPVRWEEGGCFMFDGTEEAFGVPARPKGLKKGPGGLLYMMGEGTDTVHRLCERAIVCGVVKLTCRLQNTSRSEVTEGPEVVVNQLAYGCRDGLHGWLPHRRYGKRSRSGSEGVGMKVRPRSRTSRSSGDSWTVERCTICERDQRREGGGEVAIGGEVKGQSCPRVGSLLRERRLGLGVKEM
ncbi:unnamed protein product [Arctogadus glacialis]